MINEKYSYKSFKRKTFRNIDASEFSNSEIIGACFYQEIPYSRIFPDGIVDCVFTKCNLDNCNIPEGCTVNKGTNKQIKLQKDGEYWIVDEGLNPVEPRDKDKYISFGISINPIDLPLEQLSESVLTTKDPEIIQRKKVDRLLSDTAKLIEAAEAAFPNGKE